jgi:hypothetical protein
MMTHEDFLLFVSYCQKHADLLTGLYGGRPRTLETISQDEPERVQEAFRFLSRSLGLNSQEQDNASLSITTEQYQPDANGLNSAE